MRSRNSTRLAEVASALCPSGRSANRMCRLVRSNTVAMAEGEPRRWRPLAE